MNYQQTLEYLFNTLPMFTRVGASAYKKDLTNIIQLCEALGNPQQKFKSIHIAGTNGKGSTSHMLAAILQTAGYKTGLHTSPHLYDFRERIKVDGKLCEEDFVVDFTQRVQALMEKIEPSFFEITVAMAFEYFAQQKVDIAVIETGLGGRLDSTNILAPELSVITNIGFDHMNILGNTLELIAAEKAGIIKADTPVVIGEVLPETRTIFTEKANTVNASIFFAQEKRYVADFRMERHQLVVNVANHGDDERNTYRLDLPGVYQTKNILTTLEAAHQLYRLGWNTSTSVIQKALPDVKRLTGLHGRWEVLHQYPTVVTDVGHNEDGIKQIIEQLELLAYTNLRIIIGMVKDKDIDAVLKLLPQYATYYFTQAQVPRALHAESLMQKAESFGLRGKPHGTVTEALQAAVDQAQKDDLLLICGSVFVVAEVDISKVKF
jgi:dihydrofolate synthase/folylpolyglutamate synthase